MANEKRLIELGEALRMVQNSKDDCPETSIKGRAIWETAHNCALSCLTSCNAVDAVTLPCNVGDAIYEVDGEHGVIKHEVYEVCVVFKTTATDDKGMKWDDFYTMDDIDTAYKTMTEAKSALAKMDGGNEDV